MNVSGQQSLILAGEYLPANRGAANSGRTSVALPTGGAVLQRVTVLTSRPDETLVLLRADYSSPGRTYEGRAGNSNGADAQGSHRGSEAPAYLAPAAQYARTQGSGAATATPKGATIDVLA
ncbi:MAG: hypothetical protein ACHQIL_02625 [Steroidobacterales bacterium]